MGPHAGADGRSVRFHRSDQTDRASRECHSRRKGRARIPNNTPHGGDQMNEDVYDVYAVRYAHAGGRNASMNFIDGDPHQTSDDLNFYVWAIVGATRTVLVDT